jgi:DNA polymerase III sliding clamp (beta) subunit (PCNA family)
MNEQPIQTAGAEPVNPSLLVERKPLANALAFMCRSVIERRGSIPILSHVILAATEAGGLSIMGTDMDLQAELLLPAEWLAPGRLAVEASTLRDMLKKADGERVLLTFEMVRDWSDEPTGKYRLAMDSGRLRTNIAALPVDDFPIMPEPADTVAFTLPSSQLAADFAAVAPCMSTEETRYYLNGAALQRSEGEMILIATDGHNLARIVRPLPEGAEALEDSIIPRRTVAALMGMLKGADDSPLAVGMSERAMTIKGPGFRFVSKLVDGTFPEWRRVLEPALAEEMQGLAIVELEPRVSQKAIAGMTKGLGAPVDVATGEKLALVTCQTRPEWLGLSMFAREDAAGKFHYSRDGAACGQAREYVEGLRERYGLPVLPADEDGEPARADLVVINGRAVGMTYGSQYFEPATWETRLNWETLAEERVQVGAGAMRYPDGAYSIFLPRNERPVIAETTVEVDGIVRPLRQDDAGKLEISKETVRALCGPVADMPRVEIPVFTFRHGEIVAIDGIATDGTGRRYHARSGEIITVVAKSGRGVRCRDSKLTDRQAMEHYCHNPAAFMARYVPDLRDGPEVAEAPVPAEVSAKAEIPPVQPQTEPEASTEPEAPEIAPAPAPAAPVAMPAEGNGLEEAGEIIGAMLADLLRRVAELEAAAELRANPVITPSVESAPEPLSRERARLGERVRILQGGYEDEVATVIPAREVEGAASRHGMILRTDSTRYLRCDPDGEGVQWERISETLPPDPRARALRHAKAPVSRRSPARERLLRRYLAMRLDRRIMANRLARADEWGCGMQESREAFAKAAHGAMEAKRRLARRGAAMRERRDLDRRALDASREYVGKLQHQNPPEEDAALVAQIHREREESARRVSEATNRAEALERAVDRLGDEVQALSSRAHRAEAALRLERAGTLPRIAHAGTPAARVSFQLPAIEVRQ